MEDALALVAEEDREIEGMDQDRDQKQESGRIQDFRDEIVRFPIAFPKERKTENQDRQDQSGRAEQAEKRVADPVTDATHQMRARIFFEFVPIIAEQVQKKTDRKKNADAEQDIGHSSVESVFSGDGTRLFRVQADLFFFRLFSVAGAICRSACPLGSIVFFLKFLVGIEGIAVEFLVADVFFGGVGVKSIVKRIVVVRAVFVVHRGTILS